METYNDNVRQGSQLTQS